MVIIVPTVEGSGASYFVNINEMSRGTALLAGILSSFRSFSSIKTGNTLGSAIETVRPPPEDMADGKTLTATFAMS